MSRSSLRLKRSLGFGGGGGGSGAVSGAASREAREAGITAEDGDGSDGGVLLINCKFLLTSFLLEQRRWQKRLTVPIERKDFSPFRDNKHEFYSSRGCSAAEKPIQTLERNITIKLGKRSRVSAQVWHRPRFGIGHGLRVLILPTLIPFSLQVIK